MIVFFEFVSLKNLGYNRWDIIDVILYVLWLVLLESITFACYTLLLAKRSHLKFKIFSQRFFQTLSFPLSLLSVVVIELVTFVTGIVKVRHWSVFVHLQLFCVSYISGCF